METVDVDDLCEHITATAYYSLPYSLIRSESHRIPILKHSVYHIVTFLAARY